MTLCDAAKKVFDEGIDGVEKYSIDRKTINLNCKGDDGRSYQAKLIFDDTGYDYIKAFGSDAPVIFGDKVLKLIK